MDLKKLIPILIFLASVSSSLSQLVIRVDINETIHGKATFLNISSFPILKIFLFWENIGSVDCEARMRVDFYNQTEFLYTAWSNMERVPPGSHADLETHWFYPFEENLTAKIRVYYCNEIFDVAEKKIEVKKIEPNKTVLEIVKIKDFKNSVEVSIKAKEEVRDVIIIPKKYPLGWIFEQAKIEKLEKEKTARINYNPSIWRETNITFLAITEDGKYSTEKTFTLKEDEKDYKPLILMIIFALILGIICLKYVRHIIFLLKRHKF